MGNYITVAEVKAEGVPAGIADALIERRIAKWEKVAERVTRNVFRVLEPGELTFDGNNSSILHFNVPLIEVSSVKVNDETTAITADEYVAYCSRSPMHDDRQNPKIELTGVAASSLFYRHRGIFGKGLDQKITAKWGYVDDGPLVGDLPTYVTPAPVKEALIICVVADLESYYKAYAAGGGGAATVKSETTDGHTITYDTGDGGGGSEQPGYGMPDEARQILMAYRAPIVIASPDPRFFYTEWDYPVFAL